MGTISSTWSFDTETQSFDTETRSFRTELPLKACGIDSETIERFENLSPPPDHDMPFVFSKREYSHAFSLSEPQKGLCAAFCCKEAFGKALGEPYNYTDLEIEWHPTIERYKLSVEAELREQHAIKEAAAVVKVNPLDERQLIAVVYLFEDKGVKANHND